MRQMMKAPYSLATAPFLTFALLISGCAATSAPPLSNTAAPTDIQATVLVDASNVGFGQRAYVDGPIIEPVKLLEDSRCPQNARCVWAGRLRLQMIWHRGNGEAQPFELTLGEPTHIADGNIQITSAPPAPILGEAALAPADYRFSFRFDGGY